MNNNNPQTTAYFSFGAMGAHWNRFFHTPRDTKICTLMRILFALLVLWHNYSMFWVAEMWYSNEGVFQQENLRKILDPDIFPWITLFDNTPTFIYFCLSLFTLSAFLMCIGFFSRVNCFMIFFWLVNFQLRNEYVADGSEIVFRLLAFFLMFLPLDDYLSLGKKLGLQQTSTDPKPLWALRLIQIQMSLIFLSTMWLKLDGELWLNGTALYYVARLDEFFGRFPLWHFWFENMILVKMSTWMVLAIEGLMVFGVWFKDLRRLTLIFAIGFHLLTDYSMNLFLFHWVCIVGWLSFLNDHELELLLKPFFKQKLS